MKRFYFLIIIFISIFMASCGASKKAIKSPQKDLTTVEIPIDEKYQYDNKTHYRSVGVGESMDQSLAYSMAITDCRNQLSNKLNTKIKTAVEDFAKQYGKNKVSDLNESFQSYVIVYSENTLKNTKELQKAIFWDKINRQYICYVAMEISKAEVVEEVTKSYDNVPSQTKNEIEADKNAFRDFINSRVF